MATLTIDAPEHVPPELVLPFDQLNGPEVMNFPPTAALSMAHEKPVFYSSYYGGFWVFTRYEDIRSIYQNPDVFIQWSQGFPANPFSKLYKPLYLNPPEHMPWRRVLTPIFSPRQMARYEDFVRELTRNQLAKIAPQGKCEFVSEFADVIPGRYTNLWFQPTKPGRYHLFCAEYCGTRHSGMTGEVIVMEPSEFQTWLSGGAPEGSLASAGAKLFQDLACNTCHRPDAQGRGPVLEGLFGKTVTLQNGETLTVDEAYVRESILQPAAKIASGFQPIMPTFQGLVTEEQLLELIEYVKSLKALPQVQPR